MVADLGVVEAAEVAEHDGGPELHRELGERTVDRDLRGHCVVDAPVRRTSSSGSPGTGRRLRRRSSSRHALVATR